MLSPARSGIDLTVAIASWNGASALTQCLESLLLQTDPARVEVIVATNFEARETIVQSFPHVRHLPMPSGTTVPRLRAAAVEASGGAVVALAEDHCTFDERWCSALLDAHRCEPVVGGAVENLSRDRAIDWAVYFYDYGKFMLPGLSGEAESLPGNNVSYKRAVLLEAEAVFWNGIFEPALHGEIRRLGYRLFWTPSAVVFHCKHYRTREAVTQAFHHARTYAAMRVADASLGKRSGFTAGALILPAILFLRLALLIASKRRHVMAFLSCLPHLCLLLGAWSAGEFAGYATGAGGSADKWK